MQNLWRRHRYPMLLVVLFAVQFFFVSPIGEFPLNDDWVHTEIIKHWTETGEFRMNPYAGPLFYVPILYGALLVKLFGFSFTLLRLSTLALLLTGNLAMYGLIRRITNNPLTAFLATLTLWLNPITYHLSYTFMTDIPALSLFILSLYFYYRGFSEDKPGWLALGSLTSLLGFYTRQTNGALLAAAGLSALIRAYNNRAGAKTLGGKNLILCFALPAALGAAVYFYLYKQNWLPDGQALHVISGGLEETFVHVRLWLWYTFVYLGFFFLPPALGFFIKQPKHRRPGPVLVILGAVFIALIFEAATSTYFPYVLNIVTVYGLGPLRNVLDGVPQTLVPDDTVWRAATLVFAASAGWFIYAVRHYKLPGAGVDGWLWLTAWIYLLPLLFFESFDRYWLPLWALALVILARRLRGESLFAPATLTVLALYAIFSISQTQFYLNWNRTRWDITDNFVAEHKLRDEQIDGGYEWDGWHNFWSAREWQTASGQKHGPPGTPWWVRYLIINNTGEYIVSFSPMPPYEIAEKHDVAGWNPNNELYILKRSPTIAPTE